MPVRSNFRGRQNVKHVTRSRTAKSLSPQKTEVTSEFEMIKNHSAVLHELDNDMNSDEFNQSDNSYRSLLKQLHSDFNKKYISDKVTTNSKLRWNRKVHQSPCQSDDQSIATNIFLLRTKQSPQIPSPVYSPIKSFQKELRNKNQEHFARRQMPFDTSPSSDECTSPQLSDSKKKTTISLKSPSVVKLAGANKSIQKQNIAIVPRKIQDNINKENSNRRKTQPFKTTRRGRRTKCGIYTNVGKIKDVSNAHYYADDKHYIMENVLETESEESELSTLASNSPAFDIVFSSDIGVLDGMELDSKETKFSRSTEIKHKLQSPKNNSNTIANQKVKAESEYDVKKNTNMRTTKFLPTKNSYKNNIEISQNVENFDINESSEWGTGNEFKISEPAFLKLGIDCFESSFLNTATNFKSSTIQDNVDQQNTSEENVNGSELELKNIERINNNKEDDINLQRNLNAMQNNERFHYPTLNNRINSLKSPLSTDSAHGSSIDIETNYHPKHCEIFWGRKGNFPFWPCLIWPDPEGKTLRIEKQAHRQFISYHVKFFADNGQRSWIYKDNLIAYNGREDFERKAKEQSSKMKNSIFKKLFTVSKAKLPIWDQAVREADRILSVHIEKRAEMFSEILKESIEVLKIHKQQRRFSMSMDRISSRLFHNSIIGSSDDLLNTSGVSSSLSVVSKRRGSFSAYENLAKRHKIETNSENLLPQEILTTINTNSNNFSFPKALVEFLADYTLRTTESEESFQRFEKCCIELFNIVRNSAHEEYSKGATVKKHPNRILRKKLIGKLHKQYNEILSKPDVDVEKVKKRRAILDVPSIQNILKDIVDLLRDKQYLFRHLKKGPVCNICLKPNNLMKCSGYCDSWIHKSCSNLTSEEYLNKLKEGSKKRRGKKSVLSNQLFQRKDDIEKIHITGDDEYNSSIKTTFLTENSLDNQIESSISPDKITCKNCVMNVRQLCFICKKNDPVNNKSDSTEMNKQDSIEKSKTIQLIHQNKPILVKCKLASCNKYYHLMCLDMWPQTYITKSKELSNKGNFYFEKIEVLCPSHTCHTCVSDDARHIQLAKNNIIRCVKCPATYHLHSKCVPAGAEFLTANAIICPRHTEETKPTNTDWCFLCSENGDLLCCDTCPSSFHLSCLKLNQAPNEKYVCELCQNGCVPLYGDLVWCKFSQYKWWPSVIIPPPIIPKNLFKKIHSKLGFCVRFLGTNDYGWTGRHRVYLYQEDDHSSDRKKDKSLQKAIEEAKIAWDYFVINKPKKIVDDDGSTPLPYKKIKNNITIPPVKLEYNISELNACDCSPISNSPCGYDSQCLNRVLMIECNPKICPAKFNCENQMFEKRKYAPIAICKTAGKGFGLVCTESITAGSFIIEYVGELIDDNELKRRIEEKQKEKDPHYYFFSIESNLTIDAGPKGNLARFMNHSCEPNCEPQMWTVNGAKRIGLFAKYDINEDTELTFHYNFECVGDNKVICFCGAENCKGFIGGIYNKKSVFNLKN